ncbi:cycloartenol-C-24-methyltransferase-like isoform X2 [Durio zibethinus]|uniref:Cycloartenol-C-24-methyltransferase-like isoform X2 n=1 Tax=Durio zibethinus TaxID=66656 RepID=A0A6P5ZNN8_DURZI|nr:cycloartenol-C-24-methyltransferase-like isoform X2 [Durio zibethinus]
MKVSLIQAEIKIDDGLPDIRLTRQCLDALKKANFEIIWEKDFVVDHPIPCYLPSDRNHFSLSSLCLTTIECFITKNMVKALEFVGFAPKGSQRVQDFLEKATKGLVEGGRLVEVLFLHNFFCMKEIFPPVYFFFTRKPPLKSQ